MTPFDSVCDNLMKSTDLLSIEKIQPQLFVDFSQSSSTLVETHIHNQLINQLPLQERISAVLDEISWNEWQTKLVQLVKPLSKILITLLYDKILLTLKKLENTPELNSFLEKISLLAQSALEDSTKLSEARNQFINQLEDIWKLANNSEPKTPILDYEGFSLNKLLTFIFMDWGFCLEIIDLIHKIKGDINGGTQLLLPYIFEIGIPEQQKQLQGQVFTPSPVVDFICKQNLTDKTTRIIDPACGTGLFLLGALKVLVDSKTIQCNQIELIGIEIDPVLADIADSAINYFLLINPISMIDWQVYRTDFFNCDSSTLRFSVKNSGMTTLLMNPPYTRHEMLTTEYKKFLKEKMEFDLLKIRQSPPYNRSSFSGRSGLYTYFLVHATSLLKEDDNVGLIIPNSWLDVDYGQHLQQFVLKNYLIESIINCRLKKVIPTADVNTAILKLKRKKMDAYHENNNLVKFVSINNVRDLDLLVNKEVSQIKSSSSRIQVVSVKQKALFSKSKWGIYFRAPLDYFKLLERLDKKLVMLGEIAHVRRGFTSGANDFFYVGKPGESNTFFISNWDSETGDLMLSLKAELVVNRFKAQGFQPSEPMFVIEKDYWMHRVNAGQEEYTWEYSFRESDGFIWVPNYLVKSPRSLTRY
ncbi:MAG: class I SAM-dependent DNA methyltransferase, partial [Promethearchaeota archaeon]